MRLKFDGTEEFFRGHFPDHPILPGVVQLNLAIEASPINKPLKAIKKMKFMDIIAPGDEVELKVEAAGENEVKYEFAKGEKACSSGVLSY